MATRFVRATAQGTADGSSWANAAAYTALDAQCASAGAGGEVQVLCTDVYTLPTSGPVVTLSTPVGTAGNPVTIRGATLDGRDGYATFVGNRPYPANNATIATTPGPTVFSFAGANYVNVHHLAFRHTNSCLRNDAKTHDLNISNIRAFNVRQVWFSQSGQACWNVALKKIAAKGFSKSCIRFNNNATDCLVEDFYLDGDNQYGDNFTSGITFNSSSGNFTASDGVTNGTTTFTSATATFTSGDTGKLIYALGIPAGSTVSYVNATTVTLSQAATTTATGVYFTLARGTGNGVFTDPNGPAGYGNGGLTVRRGVAKNIHDDQVSSNYWNGDGVAAERTDNNLVIEDVYVENTDDGGIDVKSTNTVIRRVTTKNCKRSFRVWGSDTKLIDCVSQAPRLRGGIGSTVHWWNNDGGSRWYGGIMDNQGTTVTAIETDGTAAFIENAIVRQPSGATFNSGTVTERNNRHEVSPV